jgi:hypothetical protein
VVAQLNLGVIAPVTLIHSAISARRQQNGDIVFGVPGFAGGESARVLGFGRLSA